MDALVISWVCCGLRQQQQQQQLWSRPLVEVGDSGLWPSGQRPRPGGWGDLCGALRHTHTHTPKKKKKKKNPRGINGASVGPICSWALLWSWLKLFVCMKYCGGRKPNPPHDLCTLKTPGSKVTITSGVKPLCLFIGCNTEQWWMRALFRLHVQGGPHLYFQRAHLNFYSK